MKTLLPASHNAMCTSIAHVVAALVAVASVAGSPARAVTYELVPVGNPGNANDPATGNVYGGVAYEYRIGKYNVTIGQYTEFLNAVAANDTYFLYNAGMATDLNIAGIARAGVAGAYTYSVINNGGDSSNRPITLVSWFDAARFANWMANGQPTGPQDSTTTESGAYSLNGATSGNAVTKNAINPNTGAAPAFYIPTEDEWYKAAYYSPLLNSGIGGYWKYATQSNSLPGNLIGGGLNQANYFTGNYGGSGYSVTQSLVYSSNQNYLTDVGAFTSSASFYGTFDQTGNVMEWNDLDGAPGLNRGRQGGYWGTNSIGAISSAGRSPIIASSEYNSDGFRLAAPVPEPATYATALAGLACGGLSMWRRRKRA